MKREPANPMEQFDAARLEMARSAIGISDLILEAGVHKLDALFGKGFALKNPSLVGQYLDATTRTFQNDMAGLAEFGDDIEFEEGLAFDLDFDPPPPPARNRRK
jgi:hypothetical protein